MKNPFPCDGEFRIVLVESKAMLTSEEQGAGAIYGTRKRPVKSVTSRINHSQRKSEVSTTGKEKDTQEESKPRPALLQQLQEGACMRVCMRVYTCVSMSLCFVCASICV